jgi:hypothetical protein
MILDDMTDPKPISEYEREERICTDRAMAQWKQSLKRPDLDEEARVRSAIEAYKRQAFAFTISPPPAGHTDAPVVDAGCKPKISVQTMRLSDGRADYYVSIKVDDRHVHPHVFRDQYKAAYHVALYEWLLNGGVEPDLLAFDEADWPAQTTALVGADPAEIEALERRVNQLETELQDALTVPWPEWAASILKSLKTMGYDPEDTAGEIDLGEAFSEYLDGVSEDEKRDKQRISEKDAEITRLKALSISQRLTIKPLDWKDCEDPSGNPMYSEAVGAGYTYVADGLDKPLSESKLDAEGRYLKNVIDCVIQTAPTAGPLPMSGYPAIYAHTVRKAALREENRNEQDLADELREAMLFIENVAEFSVNTGNDHASS